ncbi:MAG: TSUP family transporter [Lachnospiraceae bacterium]|nr:TSUP family transporter [Lachnospiraceae bacterium]
MIQYLIVCPLMFLAGLVDAIAGGGGLISLPAYIIAGVPAHAAIATNKLASSMGTTISTGRYLKNGYLKGRQMAKIAACAVVAALIGSNIGSRLSMMASESLLKNMMIVVLPIVAFYVLRNRNMGDVAGKEPLSDGVTLIIATVAALVIGTYDGFYGPGTGTFLLLVLTGLARMDVREASALTKVINLSSNISALVMFIIHGAVVYQLGLAAGVFCIAGHYLGSGLVVHNGQRIVRPVILVVLGLLFVKIITGN